jgi:hypothetical protein
MNLRYLLLLPALGLSTLFTACETTYDSDRVVYTDYGPGYDYDDTDFYYVSGAPYSRVYGRLVLRDGGYYYSRGGRYYTYTRHHRGDYSRRHYDRDHDHDRDRDRVVYNNTYRNDRDRVTYNNTYRSNRVDVRSQPSTRTTTTRSGGGYYGGASRTNVNVQRSGVSATTRTAPGASAQARVRTSGPSHVEVKKGAHRDGDRDRD